MLVKVRWEGRATRSKSLRRLFLCTEKKMKKQIHPEFLAAFHTTDVRVSDLAATVGMPKTTLGRWMAAPEIRVTPLVMKRLSTLAGLLHFSGSIFR
jgi:hypothetical protein